MLHEKAAVISQQAQISLSLEIWPELDIAVKTDADIEARVRSLLATMTLEQKVAQMIQPEIRDISVEDMRKYGFGSYLNGGGAFPENNKHATPADWIKLAENFYQASIDDSLDGSKIPTMWGTDAVHGHNNVIGATLFPHNIGLGAANNPELIESIASITAREVMVTGIDWVFAPTVAVVRDDRWGRTYEGYSEDPEIVRAYAAAIVNGLQGAVDEDFLGDEQVISTVKHFIGDGGTESGDDQGNNLASEEDLFKLHAQGYVGGLTAGAQSVMASFNSWHGVKSHGNKYLMTDVLKERMGFDGFVVGDWNGHGQVKGCSNESCPQAVNAGLDIFMVPTNAWKPLYENTIAQVNKGEISLSRIDDAVSRILRVKIRAGLFSKPSPENRPLSGKTELIGASAHRTIARQAVRESLVLLKNKDNLLPLKPNKNILVAGDGADNIGKQSGGWSITWQGTGNTNTDFPGGSSIYAGIKQAVNAGGGKVQLNVAGEFKEKPDVAIVVFGEEPYAEGNGDLDNLEYQRGNKSDLALLKRLKAQGIPVVSVFISGRPMWVNAELNSSDAFIAAWLPGSEGNGVADVLFTHPNGNVNYDFVGKLSYSWPADSEQTTVNRFDEDYAPLLPYGFGLVYGADNVLTDDLSEQSSSKSKSELTEKALFNRSAKAPLHLFLSDEKGSTELTSSVLALKTIAVKTTDRNVQEDSLMVSWKNAGIGSIHLTSAFPSDLRAFNEANGVLSFDVNIKQFPSEAVVVEMSCEQECQGSVDITKVLKKHTLKEWHTINISLSCFKTSGTDMAKVFTPFKLTSAGDFSLTLGNIYIKTESQVDLTSEITCSES
nr:exo 1,3/1,4-beta-D-glucan glucohydrolase [Colwellia psychrerythraea]